ARACWRRNEAGRGRGAFIQCQKRIVRINPGRESDGRREVIPCESLQTRLPRAVIAVHALCDVQLRQARAVIEPVIQSAARCIAATTNYAEAAAFDRQLPV